MQYSITRMGALFIACEKPAPVCRLCIFIFITQNRLHDNIVIKLGYLVSSACSYHKMACVPWTVSLLVFRDSRLHHLKDLVKINNKITNNEMVN